MRMYFGNIFVIKNTYTTYILLYLFILYILFIYIYFYYIYIFIQMKYNKNSDCTYYFLAL